METTPIPLFENQARFKKLCFETLDAEQFEVREFLIERNETTGAIESYKAVRHFLSTLQNPRSFQHYRTQIEKLLSWSICIAAKPLAELDAYDLTEFFEFCSDPPPEWVGPPGVRRFSNANHRNSPPLINPAWRPFVYPSAEPPTADYFCSAASVTLLASVCRSFFQSLGAEGLISKNPMREVDRSGVYAQSQPDYQRQSVFSDVEWDYIRKAMDDLIARDHAHERTLFLVMSIYHLYLKSGDFETYSSTMKMSDFFTDQDGRTGLNLGTDQADWSWIEVPDEYVTAHLGRYRRYLGTDSIPLHLDSTPIFSTLAGRPGLRARYVNFLFSKVLEEACASMKRDGYSDVDVQNLEAGSLKWVRHTSASVSAQRISTPELHKNLRIKNVQSTEDRYYKRKSPGAPL